MNAFLNRIRCLFGLPTIETINGERVRISVQKVYQVSAVSFDDDGNHYLEWASTATSRAEARESLLEYISGK